MKIKDIKEKVKLPAVASAFYLAASFAGKAVSALTTPFFTRILSSEEYGEFAEYISLLGAITLICSVLTSGSTVYKGLRDHGSDRREYLNGILRVYMALSIVICILLFTFSRFLGVKRHLLLPLSVQILCDGISALALTNLRFDYKYKEATLITVFSAVMPPVISIPVIMTAGGGYLVRIYSLLFVSICTAVYSLIRIWKRSKAKSETIKYIMRSTLPMLPQGISNALAIQADKLILAAIMGTAALAKYSVVFSLGIAVQFTVTAIGSSLSPWIIRRLDAGEKGQIARLVHPMIIGYFALSLCLIAVGPEAMLILAPENYLDAIAALAPLALSTPFVFISFVSTVGIIYSGKSWYTAAISLGCSLIGVALNFALIGPLGYLGAGIASFVYHLASAAAGIFALKKAGLGELIYPQKILFTCLIGGVCGSALLLLRAVIWARVILLILPCGMLLYCAYKAWGLVIEKPLKNAS